MAEKKVVESQDKRLVSVQPKNLRGEEYRFSLFEFKGHELAEIRVYANTEIYEGPTRAGITVRVEALDEFIENLQKLREAAVGKEA